MAEVNVNVEVNVDIDVDDFMDNCDENEIDEIIEYLLFRDKLKPKHFSPEEYLNTLNNSEVEEVQEWLMANYRLKFGINYVNVLNNLTKISTGLLQLTADEEEYIKSLANRLI